MEGAVAYRAVANLQELLPDYFQPDPRYDHTVTLNKYDKKVIKAGGDILRKQDEAMWSALTDIVPCNVKAMVAITKDQDIITQEIGHLAEIIHPDKGGNFIGESIKQHNPTVIYFHKDIQNDNDPISAEDKKIENILDKYRDTGHLVIIADTHNSIRWQDRNIEPYRGKGDIAMHCSDEKAFNMLKQWIDADDGYRPKCVEDLPDKKAKINRIEWNAYFWPCP